MISEAQRLARKSCIGGSDIGIILGLSTYKTPYQLYLEKKGIVEDIQEESQQQYWGNVMEEPLRLEFQKRNNIAVNVPSEPFAHPLFPFLAGNLDGFITDWQSPWEAKTADSFVGKLWGEPGSDIIPLTYLVQVAGYCAITNTDNGYISVLIGGNNYREYKYIRDLELESNIIDAVCKFWDCLQNDTPPAPLNRQDLDLLYSNSSPDKSITINIDIEEQLTFLKEIRLQIKSFEEREEGHKFNIMQYMENAEVLLDQNGRPLCTWKSNKKGQRSFLLKGK